MIRLLTIKDIKPIITLIKKFNSNAFLSCNWDNVPKRPIIPLNVTHGLISLMNELETIIPQWQRNLYLDDMPSDASIYEIFYFVDDEELTKTINLIEHFFVEFDFVKSWTNHRKCLLIDKKTLCYWNYKLITELPLILTNIKTRSLDEMDYLKSDFQPKRLKKKVDGL